MNTHIVICDFDGTITEKDSIACIFDKYMGTRQRLMSESMVTGQLQYGFDKVPTDIPLSELLQPYKVDASFRTFHRRLTNEHIPLYIVSAGIKQFIQYYLPDMDSQTIFANSISKTISNSNSNSKYLVHPYNDTGIDKAQIIEMLKAKHNTKDVIYIGDGKSDICVCDHVSILFTKRNLELHNHCVKHEYCHEVYDTFEDILSHTLFRSKPLHVHFGFGNVTCGLLLDKFTSTHTDADADEDEDLCFIKTKPLAHTEYTMNNYRILIKQGLFMKEKTDTKNVTLIPTDDIERLLRILRLKKEGLKLSTAVGYLSFDSLYMKIRAHLPDINISAYENHLLSQYHSHDGTHMHCDYDNVTPYLADRFCYNLNICDITRTIHVMVEPFGGRIMSYTQLDTLSNTQTQAQAQALHIHYVSFRQLCAMKRFMLNALHLFFALLSDDELIDGETVFDDHKGLLYGVSLLSSVYLVNHYGIHVTNVLAYAQECLERLRTCHGDKKSRILKNFDMKCQSILRPMMCQWQTTRQT